MGTEDGHVYGHRNIRCSSYLTNAKCVCRFQVIRQQDISTYTGGQKQPRKRQTHESEKSLLVQVSMCTSSVMCMLYVCMSCVIHMHKVCFQACIKIRGFLYVFSICMYQEYVNILFYLHKQCPCSTLLQYDLLKKGPKLNKQSKIDRIHILINYFNLFIYFCKNIFIFL